MVEFFQNVLVFALTNVFLIYIAMGVDNAQE
jgi:hypothetical protein